MAMTTTWAMALATTWRVMKWVWQGQQRQLSPTLLPLLPLSLPLLLRQPSSLLLLPPQLPNVVAAAVAIAHLFDTAIKWQLHGQWRQKQWLQRRGWWGWQQQQHAQWQRQRGVAGDEEHDGKSGKSNDNGNKEGNGSGGKSDSNGNKEGNGNGWRGQC
jgi:hypothetical protein